ncbi:MAG: 16S rRNA (cytidine(1402)-2'-O)-methyltransferase [Candidatus Campbellbacteria bacterium]|nr:16S rRNA (cytidine(1402)-2'-O)-methyltransferase [Candidatus Campbellbacteria bacterium]
MEENLGTLFIVGTPIGNLEDVTLRALRTLKEADVIFCEDTRVTKRLLDKYDIHTRTSSLNARTEHAKIGSVMGALTEGKKVALVSDAGTPGISDPGSLVVSVIREKMPDVRIEAIPGPSALTTALSIAGVPIADFVFLGFLPHKKGRQTLFKEIAESKRATVFYESPHRIMKTLAVLAESLDATRTISIARELTKIYEEIVRGNAQEVLAHFETRKEKQKGEFVVIVSSKK